MREPDREVWALLDASGLTSEGRGAWRTVACPSCQLEDWGFTWLVGSGVENALDPCVDGPSELRPFRIEPGLAWNPALHPALADTGPH